MVGEALELGVEGRASDPDGYGVLGRGDTGVLGVGFLNGTGVRGTARYGVWGESTQAGFYGVTGRNTNTDGTGVRGVANDTDGRTGVRGEGATGVWGSSSKTGYSGLYGQHTGSAGYGVVGDGKGAAGAGILGRNGSGYGGQFEGGKAQLMLKPGGSAGKPSGAHSKGETYMDSAGSLFVCVVGGNPAKWRKLSTTAV